MCGLGQEAELDSGAPAGDEPGLVIFRIAGQVSCFEDRTIHPVVCDGRAEIIQTSSEPAVVEAMVYGLECIVGVVFDTADDEDKLFDGGLAVRLEFVVAGTDNDMVTLQLGDSFGISGVSRNVCERGSRKSRDAAQGQGQYEADCDDSELFHLEINSFRGFSFAPVGSRPFVFCVKT